MEELVAKRYIKALKDGLDANSAENISSVFSALAESFKNDKFIEIVENPNVTTEVKSEILLEAVKPASSKAVDNLIKLLVENKRINIIPAIAEGLRKDLAMTTRTFDGVIYSDSDIADNVVGRLSDGLGKKFNANISLAFIKNDFSGIKVEVEDLGIEINFSKDRIDDQLIDHIIKAI